MRQLRVANGRWFAVSWTLVDVVDFVAVRVGNVGEMRPVAVERVALVGAGFG